MIFDDVPVDETSSVSDFEDSTAEDVIEEDADISETESAEDMNVSVIYVPTSSNVSVEAVEAYEPEYLNFNMIFGIVFGLYLISKLMRFVSKALFVRFDGGAKEA